MRPSDSASADVRAELDESLFGEPVQIQLQTILQANPFAWPWHSRLYVKPQNMSLELSRQDFSGTNGERVT
jgi:hypothetical protein